MKYTKIAAVMMTVAATAGLAACGSDNTDGATPTSTLTGALKASGSSAQKNAMAEWVDRKSTRLNSSHT